MEDQLSALEKDCEEAENKLRQQDQNMVKMISALQNLSLKPTEALFVQPLSPVNVVRSALLLRETVPYLEAYAELIKQELADLRVKQAAVRKQVEKIISQQQQLERQQAQMRALASAKTKYRAQVSKESEATKKEIKKLGSQAQDLKDLLAKLEKDKAEKRKKMAEEAKRKILSLQKSEQVKTVDFIKSDHDIINETGLNFIKAKGTLSYPAMGRVVTRYGEELSKGISSKGITIQTRNQAQVIAPFDGSVLFAGPFRGYGNLILIEHGKGYTSLLAGMNDIDCEVGQMLLAGEPVGLMPSSGQARLYMEIRKDNHPINPQSWLKN
jgi:septal ring factor EnvC (AmiA/AmiB activator)